MSDQLMTRSADERLDRLEADVAEIKDTLNDRVLGTLAEHGESLAEHGEILAGHGERLEALEVGQRGLQDELHYVKVRVDAIADHFGIA